MWEKLNLADQMVPIVTSVLGYIVTRGIARIDNFFKEVAKLREEVGQLKMINSAQWREIDTLKVNIKSLHASSSSRIKEI